MRCFDVCLFTVINEQYGEYKLALANAFCINYQKDEHLQIGDKLTFPHYTIKLVELTYGLKIHCKKAISQKSLQNFINNQIDNRGYPVIISIDVFDCYWSSLYKKVHQTHYFLVCEKSGNHYICCDPYYRVSRIDIETKLLLNISKKVYYVSKHKIMSSKKQHDISVARCMKLINKSKVIFSLNRLLETINTIDSLEKEYYSSEESDFWLSTFHQAVGYYIPGGRLLFALYLEDINTFYKNDNIAELQEKYNYLYKHWIAVSNTLMKSYLLKNYTIKKETIVNKIKHVIEYERILINNVTTYFTNVKINKFKDSNSQEAIK